MEGLRRLAELRVKFGSERVKNPDGGGEVAAVQPTQFPEKVEKWKPRTPENDLDAFLILAEICEKSDWQPPLFEENELNEFLFNLLVYIERFLKNLSDENTVINNQFGGIDDLEYFIEIVLIGQIKEINSIEDHKISFAGRQRSHNFARAYGGKIRAIYHHFSQESE